MIRQFDVFASPFRQGRIERPYLVVVQTHRIETSSRVCAPLIAERFLRPTEHLNPLFTIEGFRCYFHPVEMVTLPVRVLRNPVANLESERYRLLAALDLVFTGI